MWYSTVHKKYHMEVSTMTKMWFSFKAMFKESLVLNPGWANWIVDWSETAIALQWVSEAIPHDCSFLRGQQPTGQWQGQCASQPSVQKHGPEWVHTHAPLHQWKKLLFSLLHIVVPAVTTLTSNHGLRQQGHTGTTVITCYYQYIFFVGICSPLPLSPAWGGLDLLNS